VIISPDYYYLLNNSNLGFKCKTETKKTKKKLW